MPRRPPAALRRWRCGSAAIGYRRSPNALTTSVPHEAKTQCATALPIVLATNETLFETLHTSVGLPWWGTIVGLTCALRAGMTLPVALYQQRSIGRMIELAPMVQSWGETLKKQMATNSRNAGWSYDRYNKELQKQYRKKVNEIYTRHGCARWQLLLLPWIQIPLWVSMSLTLRHLSGLPLPWYGQTADGPAAGMSQEGFAWVTDLTLPDPTMTFPLLIGAGTLINVELNARLAKRGTQTTTQKVLTNAFRVLAVAFVPIAAHAPMALNLYWCTSAWFSVVQNVTLRIPAVRQALKLPQLSMRKPSTTAA